MPLFNGTTERDLSSFFNYLEKLNYKAEDKLSFVGQIQVIKNKPAIENPKTLNLFLKKNLKISLKSTSESLLKISSGFIP